MRPENARLAVERFQALKRELQGAELAARLPATCTVICRDRKADDSGWFCRDLELDETTGTLIGKYLAPARGGGNDAVHVFFVDVADIHHIEFACYDAHPDEPVE